MKFIIKEILGSFCVILLVILLKIPTRLLTTLATPFLYIYPLLRKTHTQKITTLFKASPFQLSLTDYYQSRLRLVLHSLKNHGKNYLPQNSTLLNNDILKTSLKKKSPLILLGLHCGPFEWQHIAPIKECSPNKPLTLLTAPAFSHILNIYLTLGRRHALKKIIFKKKGQVLRNILNTNGTLAVMADQSPLPKKEYITLWNSIKVPTNLKLLSTFLNKGGVILPISTTLSKSDHVTVTYHPTLGPLTQDNEPINHKKIKKFIQDYLQTAIESAPLQWNWSYPGVFRL